MGRTAPHTRGQPSEGKLMPAETLSRVLRIQRNHHTMAARLTLRLHGRRRLDERSNPSWIHA